MNLVAAPSVGKGAAGPGAHPQEESEREGLLLVRWMGPEGGRPTRLPSVSGIRP